MAKPAPRKSPRKEMDCREGGTEEATARNVAPLVTSPELAALATSPELAAYRIIRQAEATTAGVEIDPLSLVKTLRDQAAAVNRGDLSHAEAMLMNQATALQTLFSRLAARAMENTNRFALEFDMKIALRAQNQCRATLETLMALRKPPVVIARQANIAHGHQQVNNGTAVPSRAQENGRENSENPEHPPHECSL